MIEPLNLESVLPAYAPAIANARWTALGSAGGFSGSCIWRGVSASGEAFALKAYPADADVDRIRQAHQWMAVARAAGLDFVPRVEPCRNMQTCLVAFNRVWEVASWMPGVADFHVNPTQAKLFAAVTAMARIHEAVSGHRRESRCPAIVRRWQAMLDGERLIRGGRRPRFAPDDPVAAHAEAAWRMLPSVLPIVKLTLSAWVDRVVPLQPCVGDVWHDHILFEGERVTGVIDYGAAKVDHVAADLARLLGSLVPDLPDRMQQALSAYAAIRPLPNPELVSVLDATGVVGAVVNWLRRLDREVTKDRTAIARRLEVLVRRLSRLIGPT